jgi:hypothetical protein
MVERHLCRAANNGSGAELFSGEEVVLVRHLHPSGASAMPARLTTQGIALLKTGWKAVQTVENRCFTV